jgi:RNA methyltransferase, TrmH family
VRITSPHNPVVKYVRSLQRASVRRRERVFLAEGVRLVRDALQCGQQATYVFHDPSLLQQTVEGSLLLADLPGWSTELYEVGERVLGVVAETETPAGVVAVLKRPDPLDLSSVVQRPFGVILDSLSDPGNVGTIIRTAAAAGVDYILATSGTVDLYAPKVVRAGMGGHFRVPLADSLNWNGLRQQISGITLIACDISARRSVYEMSWPTPAALVIGSEARGLSEEAISVVETGIRIPMRPGVESLNASVAAAIVIYAALGQSIESDEVRYR